ncbi:hypothetical protein AB0M36_02725 [Actinoplanes sp. NPDC051346]|uniref:sulfotransferase-like domain-containing protein n=1 Tax=Actinoplanes sp. NPDC051346 TaxID=3155048 RepID=UPI00341C0FE7
MNLDELRNRHDAVHVVLAPPRSASTAFARVLWNSTEVAHYSHEPYETTYYHGLGSEIAWKHLAEPLALGNLLEPRTGNHLLVKEMTFQVGPRFAELVEVATSPLVFIVRDPRLTISSRRAVKARQNEPLDFPLEQTGWLDLWRQIQYCREQGVAHLLVDASDFRSEPASAFSRICRELGLGFHPGQLSWEPAPELNLSRNNPGGLDEFYVRVLNSRKLEAPTEEPPPVTDFPEEGGLRDHVMWAMDIYESLALASAQSTIC